MPMKWARPSELSSTSGKFHRVYIIIYGKFKTTAILNSVTAGLAIIHIPGYMYSRYRAHLHSGDGLCRSIFAILQLSLKLLD
jgi:hypothetical protein